MYKSHTVACVDDILETVNHFRLVDYMLDKSNEQLTEDMIKELVE